MWPVLTDCSLIKLLNAIRKFNIVLEKKKFGKGRGTVFIFAHSWPMIKEVKDIYSKTRIERSPTDQSYFP